jgi:nucleoside-diphosphate-sugar epimerase
MKAFVTGAAGLLGVSLVRALRWEGHHVSALLPPTGDAFGALFDSGVRLVRGSPVPSATWLGEVDGADCLFHAAPPSPGVAVLGGDDEDWPVCTLTTAPMIGPGDLSASIPGRWILEFLRTGNIGPAVGGTCLVDARDVALTMISAAEVHARGEFAVAGHWVDYSDILMILEDLTGRKARPDGRVVARAGWPAGSVRAVNELNAQFRPVEETLRDTIAHHLSNRSEGRVA